jgi:hypothetical protein
MSDVGERRVLPRKLRAQAEAEYQKLSLEERKAVITAYKFEREIDPKLDWQSWLWRQLEAARSR